MQDQFETKTITIWIDGNPYDVEVSNADGVFAIDSDVSAGIESDREI